MPAIKMLSEVCQKGNHFNELQTHQEKAGSENSLRSMQKIITKNDFLGDYFLIILYFFV